MDTACPIAANIHGHENIEWSIGYFFHLTDEHKDLPRILLTGDSICNAYQGLVQERLEGKLNVSYWASSYCLTMPIYRKLLDIYLDTANYEIIHFNQGLHSLESDPELWEKCLKETLIYIHMRQPQAKLIWCSSTPLTDPALTEKVRALNARAEKVIKELDFEIAINDLFSVLDPLDREENWSDTFHHKAPARELSADTIADIIRNSYGIPNYNEK